MTPPLQRGVESLHSLVQDFRFGGRQLLRNPGFTVAAAVTLALGIGANTAIFSVVSGVLLKPLPYPEPSQLMTLWERSPERGIDQEHVSGPNFIDWRAQNNVFSELAISPGWEGGETVNLVLRDTTMKVHANFASASLFTTLGTKPLLGRTLLPEEDRKEGNQAAVLGYDLWQRLFEGNSNVIGQTITIDTYGRRDYTVVGVMPREFGVPSQCELWLPFGWMGVTLDQRRSAHWYTVLGRLKRGVTLAQASADLNAIQARLNQEYRGETIGSQVAIVPMLQQAVGRTWSTALLVLWGVVGSVLLIACANVANLMLARAAVRQKEMALRLALGAGRWRLTRQLLAESIVLALIGGILGEVLGWWGLKLFVSVNPSNIPRLHDVTLNSTALGFTLGISVLTGVLFGLAPAWHFSRPDLNMTLKEGTRAVSAGLAAGRTRGVLTIVEVALSVVLLTAAGLMIQSFGKMLRADHGFQPEHLLTAELDFSVSGFTTWVRPTATRPQVPLRELIERLRVSPGVQAVGAGSRLLRRENRPPSEPLTIFGRATLRPEEQPKAEFTAITPDWVRALGAHLLRGRDISETDILEAPGAVLINETFARRFFPNEEPIGQRLRMGHGQPPLGATNVWGLPEWSTIVGVIRDVKSLHPQPQAAPEIYQSYWQWPMQSPTLLVRATGDPALLAQLVRRETKAVIPNLPVPSLRTMDSLLSETVAQPRFQTGLLCLFACLALLLAAVGLYGVLAYAVAQRTHEIGVRMALGARKLHVLSIVIFQGLRLALAGISVGILVALALTRTLRNLLYSVQPIDPLTFAAVPLLLLIVALVACWIPARRAAAVDPIEALRYE